MSQIESPGESTPNVVKSDSPTSLTLTAYQSGPAVIREVRTVKLPAGKSRIYIGGLPKEFVPNSQTVTGVSGTGKFKVGSRSLRPANMSVQALLLQSIGKRIVFIEDLPNSALPNGQRRTEGTLQTIVDNRYAVLTTTGDEGSDGVLVVPITAKFRLPDGIPAGLSDLSILVMEPDVETAGEFGINLLYEANQINWTPWYEIFYNRKLGKLLRFACYVDLPNNSGTNIDAAAVKLIAGHNDSDAASRAARKSGPVRLAMAQSVNLEAAGGAAPQADYSDEVATVEDIGDSKMYKLTQPVLLENGVPNNPTIVLASEVPVSHEYHAYSGEYSHLDSDNKNDLPKGPVNVKLRLVNDAASGLNVDLPPGPVRIFEPDSSGELQKTQTARITGHVSRGEPFSLDLRNPARDLKVTRERVDYKEDPKPPKDEGDGEERADNETGESGPPVHALEQAPQVTASVQGGPGIGTPGHEMARRAELLENATSGDGNKEKKEKKKPAPRYAEEERELTLLNYRDAAVEVIVHESVPVGAEFLSNSQSFASFNTVNGSGIYRITVPAKDAESLSGSAKIRYRIRYRLPDEPEQE